MKTMGKYGEERKKKKNVRVMLCLNIYQVHQAKKTVINVAQILHSRNQKVHYVFYNILFRTIVNENRAKTSREVQQKHYLLQFSRVKKTRKKIIKKNILNIKLIDGVNMYQLILHLQRKTKKHLPQYQRQEVHSNN